LIMHGTVRVTPLGVAGSVDPGLHVTTASTTFWAIPWTLLALIVVFVALVMLAVVWRRRLNARPAAHSAKSRNAGPAFGEA
jgi:heme/copper-type cytochrome/quinol oxidase subunit 2